MFLSRYNKNNVYPCKPQFYYIKVGSEGLKVIKVRFRDVILIGIITGELEPEHILNDITINDSYPNYS